MKGKPNADGTFNVVDIRWRLANLIKVPDPDGFLRAAGWDGVATRLSGEQTAHALVLAIAFDLCPTKVKS